MVMKLPPTPIGVPPGHSFWNDWYEKLRDLINTGAVAVTWSNIDFSGSNITDLVSRSHQNLQNLQGGTAGEYYHLTQTQHSTIASLPTLATGTYTPTLTNVANVTTSAANTAQYMRVGNMVTVSGRLTLTPTAAATATQLHISLPVASNFSAAEQCGGTAAATAFAGGSSPILADAATDTARMQFISFSTVNTIMYYSFMYQII